VAAALQSKAGHGPGGRVLDLDVTPINDAQVEIWQCDAKGRYIHSGEQGGRPRTPGSQGDGKMRSGSDGRYRLAWTNPASFT
jgi:protocatechuate 3,4-dioxygenase beta subunit